MNANPPLPGFVNRTNPLTGHPVPDNYADESLEWIGRFLRVNGATPPAILSGQSIQRVIEVARPLLTEITYPDPAAGVLSWRLQLPNGAIWEPIALRFTLSTDVNVANRIVQFVVSLPDARGVYTVSANLTQTASQAVIYTAAPSGVLGQTSSLTTSLSAALIPLPVNFRLPPSAQISLAIGGGQAGDQFTTITLLANAHPLFPLRTLAGVAI